MAPAGEGVSGLGHAVGEKNVDPAPSSDTYRLCELEQVI